MKNQKSNITLKNLSDIENGGFYLALKKGLNELFNKKSARSEIISKNHISGGYNDMLSVIICTSKRFEQASNAVNSILNQDFDNSKLEVILVNNSQSPFPKKPFSDKITIVDEPTLGLSRARNSGARAARGEYLLYIDDDAEALESLLTVIYSAFKEHQKTAIIGGQILLSIPSPPPAVFMSGKEAVWSGYTVPYKIFKSVREQYEFPFGACFAIRHSALDVLGGFPENYGRCGNNFAGGEETALCFKARKYGYKIGIEPNAKVVHCISEDRFTKEHVRRTLYEGIVTTYRLCRDGYTPYKWTQPYIKERINILNTEITRLKKQNNALAVFYKECELDAFLDVETMIENGSD